MRIFVALIAALACAVFSAVAVGQTSSDEQESATAESTTADQPFTQEIVVTAPRVDIPLKDNPAATTVVPMQWLDAMPRGVGAEEALDAVPGVKVDNQANGERVHVSIRGQGILTERGVRGIQVILDGLPLNDPTGFAPDLFDVDWATVDRLEVVRGPVAFLYGGGSSGGIINIETRNGKPVPYSGGVWGSSGSNGFWKTLGEFGGSKGDWNYRVSGSRTMGDGYRDHTAFDSTNFYGKANWKAADKLSLNFIAAGTDFFNENAEGLNLAWLAEDRTMANPDAIKYNEYQKTGRFTGGIHGVWNVAQDQVLTFTGYGRKTEYRESVPSSVIHRSYVTPGTSAQYDFTHRWSNWANTITGGMDLDGQSIDEYRHPNLGDAVEGPELLSNQTIDQSRVGLYLMDRVDLGAKWALLFGVRRDRIHHNLTDFLKLNGLDLSGEATFAKTTGRVGVTYNPKPELGLYASWGQGFQPPATEELYANPDALGGFNEHLIPATSRGEEVGVRGSVGQRFFYDVAVFHLVTDGDFERYRVPSRPLETFYRNAGNTRRYGTEAGFDWFALNDLTFRVAYAYADYIYTYYQSFAYPGNWTGNFLPNSPAHMAEIDAEYKPGQHWLFGANVHALSHAYIDVTNQTWIDGYGLLDLRVGYRIKIGNVNGQALVTAKNLTNTEYIAFTEPDPDGNSYQPGPMREFFGGLEFWF